jgi:anti-anti-sigma factor
MTTPTPTHTTTRLYRQDPARASVSTKSERHGRATFSVKESSSSLAHVVVSGDIDALNGRALAGYVERKTGGARRLILDLRDVEFFGSLGFTALCYIRAHCRQNDADWLIAGSRPVRRLLAICDPEGRLPLA